ncbi:MAG: cupin domain-containing protein [Flexilinea sp.]|jgi:gentisate 1,2-dioxygenase
MDQIPEYFCNFPFKPNEKRPCVINDESAIKFIYTENMPESSDLNWVFVSTENLTFAKYQLAPGSTFDPVDVHSGDEIYYILEGTVTMLNAKLGQVVDVNQNEAVLLPKGAPHKAYNFTNKKALILYVIAPKIWEKDGPPMNYTGEMKLFKFNY